LKGEKEKSKTAVEKWGEIQRDFSFKVGLWNQLILGEAGSYLSIQKSYQHKLKR
jgi:hypothetical protein